MVVLVALVVLVGIVRPEFLGTGNLLSTAQSSSYVGLLACGMVFPLAMREVDLSVGGNYAFGVVLGAVLMVHGWTPWLAALALVVACSLLGALNGLVTTLIGAPSFIVTHRLSPYRQSDSIRIPVYLNGGSHDPGDLSR